MDAVKSTQVWNRSGGRDHVFVLTGAFCKNPSFSFVLNFFLARGERTCDLSLECDVMVFGVML